jgi:hypothetical protein
LTRQHRFELHRPQPSAFICIFKAPSSTRPTPFPWALAQLHSQIHTAPFRGTVRHLYVNILPSIISCSSPCAGTLRTEVARLHSTEFYPTPGYHVRWRAYPRLLCFACCRLLNLDTLGLFCCSTLSLSQLTNDLTAPGCFSMSKRTQCG